MLKQLQADLHQSDTNTSNLKIVGRSTTASEFEREIAAIPIRGLKLSFN
jgi:hypothetical protein